MKKGKRIQVGTRWSSILHRQVPVMRLKIVCSCGESLVLHGVTNQCRECDRMYNMSGQALRPDAEWL